MIIGVLMSNLLNKYSLFIFDWDGTLSKSFHLVRDSVHFFQSSLHLSCWSEEDIRSKFQSSLDMFLKEYYSDCYDDALYLFNQKYSSISHNITIDEYTIPLLKKLLDSNKKVCLLTNKPKAVILREVREVSYLFDFIISSDDVVKQKPACDGIHKAILLYGDYTLNKDNICLIGDSPCDQLCAENFSCDFISIGGMVRGLYNFKELMNFYNKLCG